jgi:DNA polymerase-3 subunit gamma/tau
VAGSDTGRGGSVSPSTPQTQPAQPTFSPFESDTRRKSGPSGSADGGDAAGTAKPLEVGILVLDPLVPDSPVADTVDADPAVTLDEQPQLSDSEETSPLQHEPPEPEVRGHVSPEAERHAADIEEEIASDGDPEPPAPGAPASIVDTFRDAITEALHDKGHETASALLRAGQWSLAGETIQVSVAVKKTMLSLTMNPEAERIARTALQQAGSSAKLVVLPGDGSAVPISAPAAKANGSIQSHALDNPLVKQAQELFRAEVRSVLDLRGKN